MQRQRRAISKTPARQDLRRASGVRSVEKLAAEAARITVRVDVSQLARVSRMPTLPPTSGVVECIDLDEMTVLFSLARESDRRDLDADAQRVLALVDGMTPLRAILQRLELPRETALAVIGEL